MIGSPSQLGDSMDKFILPLKRYADFQGRSRRSEYWYFFLFVFLVSMVLNILAGMTGTDGQPNSMFSILGLIFGLATLIPSLAVGVRRLHDVNKSGWFILWGLIPLIGFIILIIQYVKEGDSGPNRFGPDPKGATDATVFA